MRQERILSLGGRRGHRINSWLPRSVIRLFVHYSLLYLILSAGKTLDKVHVNELLSL